MCPKGAALPYLVHFSKQAIQKDKDQLSLDTIERIQVEETVIQFGLCCNHEKSADLLVVNYKVGKKFLAKSLRFYVKVR